MRGCLALVVAILIGLPSAHAENQQREFLMSCTYGVMAGTLVGGASLAFQPSPGSSLSNVARGASIGLYAGILLGLYVIYVVPGLEEGPSEEEPVALSVNPLFRLQKFDGFTADWTVVRF